MCNSKKIVIWNNSYSKSTEFSGCDFFIKEEFLSKFLCENTQESINSFDSIIILAELTWNGKLFSDFYGFEIAIRLRLKHKIILPIIMVSFLPESFFNSNKNYDILKARGTGFIQLPFLKNALSDLAINIRPLSQASLADISSLLLNPRHLIDRFTHDIRFELDKNVLREKIKLIFEDIPTNLNKTNYWNELAKKIVSVDISENEFYLLKKEIVLKLNTLLMPDFDNNTEIKRYKILLLEDNEEDAQKIKIALQSHYELIHFSDSTDIIQFIKNDDSNEYHALICDWRLFEPGTNKQQQWQGYEVMEYAAIKRYYALFSLTSLDEDSRRYISPYISCSYIPLTKDFEKGQNLWELYVPIINQRIENTLAILAGLPTGEGWNKQDKVEYKRDDKGNKSSLKKIFPSLQEQYLEKRNNLGFNKWNSEITETTNHLWKYYQRSLAPESDMSLQDISTKWGIELNRNVRNILIIRRLFLALWYNQSSLQLTVRLKSHGQYQIIENPVLNIYTVLRKKYWNDISGDNADYCDEITYKKLLSAAKAFTSQLAIEPKSLPIGILPEEKAWLNSVSINIQLGNDVDYYDND